jgi:AraC family transcriptional regulator, transcriptional activator of pobA
VQTADTRGPVPRFFLYGEPPRNADERFVHVETIADRSRLHDWHIRAHAHRELHHVLVISSGGGQLQAETQHHSFQSPALLTVPAGVVHGFAFLPETEGYVVTFAEALFRGLAREEPAFRPLFMTARCAPLGGDPAQRQDLAGALPRLKRELAWQAPAGTAAVTAHLTTILVSAARALHQPGIGISAAASARATLVARFREQMESHLRVGLTIGQYAKALNVTPAQLRAACVEITAKPPIRVLEERMLLEATRALTYTNMTVAETAYYLGFSDPAYFSRFFRKLAGESAAAFRRRVTQ